MNGDTALSLMKLPRDLADRVMEWAEKNVSRSLLALRHHKVAPAPKCHSASGDPVTAAGYTMRWFSESLTDKTVT